MSEQEKEQKKTFWPYAILLSIIAIAIACIATVIVSLNYPVYMDDFYLDSYGNVDKNYNQIQLSQQKFDENFKLELLKNEFSNKKSINLELKINSFGDKTITNKELLITTPYSSEFDQRPPATIKDGTLKVDPINLTKVGRYQLILKLTDSDGNVGFFKFEFFVGND